MPLVLGDVFPNFEVDTTHGKLNLYDYIGNGWGILFSHPSDFTPVCTTELGRVAKLVADGEFAKRNVKAIAVSCDSVESHRGWIGDITCYNGLNGDLPYPIIADQKRELAVKLGMLDEIDKDAAGMPVSARAVFIIGPDRKLKLSILYPATTGRNFDEILRVIDSLQLTANYLVATPADWKRGADVMITPTVSAEDAKIRFPKGYKLVNVPSGKKYIRITSQPESKL